MKSDTFVTNFGLVHWILTVPTDHQIFALGIIIF
jgi:hypothetical protein